MIVYNVNRQWFDKKNDAEKYRISQGLRPEDTIKIEINDRRQLAALLNGLCEPPAHDDQAAMKEFPAPAKVMDNAYVPTDFEIPRFLRESRDRLLSKKAD